MNEILLNDDEQEIITRDLNRLNELRNTISHTDSNYLTVLDSEIDLIHTALTNKPT